MAESMWPEKLVPNKGLFDSKEVQFIGQLLTAGQEHLFSDWDPPGTNDEDKHALVQQLKRLHDTYVLPGGLFTYLKRAKNLLQDSKKGVNPLEGWTPEVPMGVSLDPSVDAYFEYESSGMEDLGYCGFVLVAGGLGERLGYNDIKIGLPIETTTMTTYIEFYIKQILTIQKKYAPRGRNIPLAIMVSDDTEAKTVQLLQQNSYFGMAPESVTILKQEKVAALLDNDAHIAKSSTYKVDAKPHGHGDVHALMYNSSTASKWFRMGVRWVVFFQDTNGLGFKTLPAMVGVSKRLNLEVNSATVPRVAKQAVGAICRLRHADGREMTVNVEYNQLDPVLRATVNPNGDVNDPTTGLSPFPGNINQLIFKMSPYMRNLMSTSGVMAEFVNPKYADSSKTTFKKPTRLECMMQDYPKILGRNAKVGFTSAPAWLCYSPCKNNAKDAADMARRGVPGGSAVTAEADQYNANAHLMRLLGCTVEMACESKWLGIPAHLGPAIVFDPSFAMFPGELKARIPRPHQVCIKAGSTLIVSGNVRIESLRLDGALVLTCAGRGRLAVRVPPHVTVRNKGYKFVGAGICCEDEEAITMRGYRCKALEDVKSTAGDLQDLTFVGDDTVTDMYWRQHLANKELPDDCGCSVS